MILSWWTAVPADAPNAIFSSLFKPENNRKDHTIDDKKLNELLNKALASLNDEQKKKAKACRTAKELLDFLAEAGIELPDEALEKVAGGRVIVFAEIEK